MIGKVNFSEEFKRNPAAKFTERAYPVAEVSKRLGISPHSHILKEEVITTEPRRVCQRPFGLSYAAMAGSSSMA